MEYGTAIMGKIIEKHQKPKTVNCFVHSFESSDLRARLKLHYAHKNTSFYIVYFIYNKYNI